jgi:HEAT repeat protein
MQATGWESGPPGGCSDPASLERAIRKLKSLHEGDQGLIEIIACGKRAIPALRALLFEREPSGLFQTRCLAVKALAVLKAYDVLTDFLSTPRRVTDAVEGVGDDAVINAAARALADSDEEQAFPLLISLAEAHILPGVIAALGAFKQAEALPYLIAALAEDESRPAAESALRNLGPFACQALIVAAARGLSSVQPEGDSRLRQRRSAIALLSEIGIQPQMWPALRPTMQDQDAKIAVSACKICLAIAPASERREAVRILIGLLEKAGAALSLEIQACLTLHFDTAAERIAAALQDAPEPDANLPPNRTRRALLRVKAQAEALATKSRNSPET